MSEFTIDPITVKIAKESGTYKASPGQKFEVEVGTYLETALMSHPSGWLAYFAVVSFPQAEKLMGRFVLNAGNDAPPLDKLKTSGNLDIQLKDGQWVCTIRAMRQPPGKQWPTLHQITREELDALSGKNFEVWMSGFGNVSIGRYGDLNPGAGKNTMNGLGMSLDEGNFDAIAAMVAVTRPVALVKGLK